MIGLHVDAFIGLLGVQHDMVDFTCGSVTRSIGVSMQI